MTATTTKSTTRKRPGQSKAASSQRKQGAGKSGTGRRRTAPLKRAKVESAAQPEPTETTPPAAAPPDDSQELVVFAFRLTRAERDAIHEAAGPAKASRFVRSVALAAAGGDMKALRGVLDYVAKQGE